MTLTIGQRITLGFTIVIIVTGILGVYSLTQLDRMSSVTRLIAERDSEVSGVLLQVTRSHQRMRDRRDRAWQNYLLREQGFDAETPAPVIEQWQQERRKTDGLLGELASVSDGYADSAFDPRRKELWGQLSRKSTEAQHLLDSITAETQRDFDGFRPGNVQQLAERIEGIYPLRSQFTDAVRESRDIVEQLIAAGRAEVQEIYERAWWSILVALLAAVLITIVAVTVLRRSIMGPLREFIGFVDAVGSGDLTQRTNRTRDDELGRLGGTLNGMVEGLGEVARQIRSATERLASSAAEFQAQAQQQAASTSEQNASIQQITSTMEEVSETGAQISERANAVAGSAEAASSASRSGLDAAEETGRAMASIRQQAGEVAENIVSLTEKTRSISEIIATVNDISERSSLLAFNASIEAAAAGKHGDTFSVVAEEIKHLADQAKNATAQVRSLLGDIQQGISKAAILTEEAVKRADTGASTSESTLSTIRELVKNIEDSVNVFQQIVASTNQQQIGVEQVTQSVQSIRKASEQMTAGTVQLEGAAGHLATISEQLRAAVEQYRL